MNTLFLAALLGILGGGDVPEVEASAPCEACAEEECGCDAGCGLLGNLSPLCWLKPSDHCYDCFISPMTNPLFFEDPRTLTEARLIFVHHQLPPELGSGDLNYVALQARAALTENLSFIATKDGFIFASDDAPLDDGWADVAAGLKYNIYKDPDLQRIVSIGGTYALPVGSTRALQGRNDGEFHLFATGGTQLGDSSHWISGAGVRLPSDNADGSQMSYWSNHVDTLLWWPGVYALAEVNWYHWMKSGNGGVPGYAGLDLFNFGSTGVAGNDVVTGAFGFKYKPSGNLELGVAWEVPVSGRHDVIDNRLTVDCIVRY